MRPLLSEPLAPGRGKWLAPAAAGIQATITITAVDIANRVLVFRAPSPGPRRQLVERPVPR